MGSGYNEDNTLFKRQIVRVFTPSNQFITVWSDAPLLSNFKETINGGTSTLEVELPRSFDNFGQPTYPGSKGDITQGNIVQYWLYGPGLPDTGLLRYQGIIDKYEPGIDAQGKESTIVTITPYASILGDRGATSSVQFGITGNAGTYIDPVTIFNYWFSHNDALTGVPYCNPLTLDPNNPSSSGRAVAYTFLKQKMASIFETILLMLPHRWFYRLNTDRTVTLTQAPTTPQHKLYLGKHLVTPKYSQDWTILQNVVQVQGKGVASVKSGLDIPTFGQRLLQRSDTRLTDQSTCDAIASQLLAQNDQPLLRSPIRLIDYRGGSMPGIGYDIETVKVGDTIEIIDTTGKNTPTLWDNFQWDQASWDFSGGAIFNQVVQITELTYGFDYIDLALGAARPSQSRKTFKIESALADYTMFQN